MIPYPASLQPVPGALGTFTLTVEADHPAFHGHFPGQPILPGVVQVDWALRLGREAFGELGAFRALEHLKFQATIGPGEPVTLRLAWDAAQRQLAFNFEGKSKGFAVFA